MPGYWNILSQVSSFVGFDRDPDGADFPIVRDIVESGYRQFLYPPGTQATKGERHEWSFMKPEAELTWVGAQSHSVSAVSTANETFTVSGDVTTYMYVNQEFSVDGSTGNDGDYTVKSISYDSGADTTTITVDQDITDGTADGDIEYTPDRYPLPSDFGGMRDPFSYKNWEAGDAVIEPVSPRRLQAMRANLPDDGDTRVFAIMPETHDGSESQQWVAVFFPTPTETDTLVYTYERMPGDLASTVSEGNATVGPDEYSITGVDTGAETFTIGSNDLTDRLSSGDHFEVTGSTGNDGTWIVDSISESGGDTTITVSEDITDGTADGKVKVLPYSSLSDSNADFSTDGVASGDKVVITSISDTGPAPGIYEVWKVDSATQITLDEAGLEEGMVAYDIYEGTIHLLGGDHHYETILETCLSVAESRMDDMQTQHHTQQAQRLLEASVRFDRSFGKPKTLGYNGGEAAKHQRRYYPQTDVTVYYNGTDVDDT